MAKRLGKGRLIGGAAALALAVLLGWAWRDGGERPLTQLTEPALLPQVAS